MPIRVHNSTGNTVHLCSERINTLFDKTPLKS